MPLADCLCIKTDNSSDGLMKRDNAFYKMKLLVAADSLSSFPNHSKWFDIYTYSAYYQMAAFIIQDVWPVACNSKNLNSTQQNHTTTGKEMLSIAATLNEFWSMILAYHKCVHLSVESHFS